VNAELVFSFQEFLKLVPGLLLFPITVYFALKKIGTSVTYYPTIGVNRYGMSLTSIVLVNNRDKPIVIKGLIAVCNKTEYEIEHFEAPLVIKSYESALVKPSPFSYYSLHGEEVSSPFSPFDDLELYLELFDDNYRCIPGFRKSEFWQRKVRARFKADKRTVTHNGKVYNPYKISYIVDFIVGSEQRSAFISPGGAIYDADGLEHNFISTSFLNSEASAQAELRRQNPGMVIHVASPPAIVQFMSRFG
jgi:hypothetical protein